MGLIYLFSDQPDLPRVGGNWLDFLVKKSLHALAYAILCRLWLRALAPDGRPSPAVRNQVLAICLLWAASDEWHQTFVPGRTGRPRDVLVDALGVLAALATARPRPPDRQ
jgi:VanZ family protein